MAGTLRLDGGELRFAGEGNSLSIHRYRIRSVRRLRASPVLEVGYSGRGGELTVLLYFAEPPAGPSGTGLERTAGGMSLRAANRELKGLVREWAAALGR